MNPYSFHIDKIISIFRLENFIFGGVKNKSRLENILLTINSLNG